mgnify:FL=1
MVGNWFKTFFRVLRHRSQDTTDTRRAIPADMVQRLMERVAASEQRHTGEIRIYVESSLPSSYLWRGADTRERAVMMFSKLRVWDTAQNNGVLIYLMLAEHAIELVADRGIDAHVPAQHWQMVVTRMADAFRSNRYEDGLTQALEEVSAVLVEHFPAMDAAGASQPNPNELPDAPVLG